MFDAPDSQIGGERTSAARNTSDRSGRMLRGEAGAGSGCLWCDRQQEALMAGFDR